MGFNDSGQFMATFIGAAVGLILLDGPGFVFGGMFANWMFGPSSSGG